MRLGHVAGLGFWAPGIASPLALPVALPVAMPVAMPVALIDGQRDPTAQEPACGLLPPRLARRASLLTRMLLEVAAQAGTSAGVDLRSVATVFGTARGEVEMLDALLEMLTDDGQLSPSRFHNSVYNTASGHFSIAAVNRGFSTTLAVGHDTVALALIEAGCLLRERAEAVLIVVGDDAVNIPFVRRAGAQPLAAAICLTRDRPAGQSFGTMAVVGRCQAPAARTEIPTQFADNPIAPVLPLLSALQRRSAGEIALSGGDAGWLVEIGQS